MKSLLEVTAMLPELTKVNCQGRIFYMVRTGINCANVVDSINGFMGELELKEYEEYETGGRYSGTFWPSASMSKKIGKEIEFYSNTLYEIINKILG